MVTSCLSASLTLLLLLSSDAASVPASDAKETIPPGRKIVALTATPATVTIDEPFRYTQLLLTATLDDGQSVDVTRMAERKGIPDFLSVSPRGLVRATKDGQGAITLRAGDQEIQIPATARHQADPFHPSFIVDINPVLSKMGCNQGTCHGAQAGKNGFKLSLRGYDPLFDHRALTDDHEGRRFNRAAPDRSLMLLKTSGEAPHVGGVLTQPGEVNYELLRRWIADGVPFDPNAARVTKIEIQPTNPVIPLPGMKQQMAIIASYSDGTSRDVTAEAFIDSGNIETASVDKQGLVTSLRRGEAPLLARFEGQYAATTMICMGDRNGFVWEPVPQYNYIDQLVDAKLERLKIQSSGLCSDDEFLRRVSLDLTGLPPSAEEVRAFLADPRPSREKRDALVDKLVGSPAYVEYWTNKWSDLLQVNRKYLTEKGAWAMRYWIRQAITRNMPYDSFVRAILTGSGSTFQNPPAAYWRVQREAGAAMENTTQLFLGVRFNCNKCHDHPFERWTQDQYYHLAAYFTRVGRKTGTTEGDEIVLDVSVGEIKHDRTGEMATPQFPYENAGGVPSKAESTDSQKSRREQLADWLTAPQNPYFARSYVNRIWSYLMGVGLIEPADDIRAGNPPTNPELLDRLTEEFIASGFDVQKLVRTICKSRVYQQSIQTNKWNDDDAINYSHALARRLPAETLYDTLHFVTGVPVQLPGLPTGFRAVQTPDSDISLSGGGFLDLFGRPARESACECERNDAMMLGPIMKLVNGPTLAEAIRNPNNKIARLVARENDNSKVVEELFLTILNRPPTKEESKAGIEAIQSGDEERKLLEAQIASYEKEVLPKQTAERERIYRTPVTWKAMTPASAAAKEGSTLVVLPDSSVLAGGTNPERETTTLQFALSPGRYTGLQLEALFDPSLPNHGPGRAANGNFVLNELAVTLAPASKPTEAKGIRSRLAKADFSQEKYGIEGSIDNNPKSGWAVMPQFGKAHSAQFEFAQPIEVKEPSILTVRLDQSYGSAHTLGRVRLSTTEAELPASREPIPEAMAKVLAIAASQRTPEQQVELTKYFADTDPQLIALRKELEQHLAMLPNPRLTGAQDLAWALLNSPAFLFNH